MKNTRYC